MSLKGLGAKTNWLVVNPSRKLTLTLIEDRNRIQNRGYTEKILKMDQNGLHF
jgi:hypothetical protein